MLGGIFQFISILIELFASNSGDPDQTPRFSASGLGLHYLTTSHKKDARRIWVKLVAIKCSTSFAFYLCSATRFINSILHENLSNILYVLFQLQNVILGSNLLSLVTHSPGRTTNYNTSQLIISFSPKSGSQSLRVTKIWRI